MPGLTTYDHVVALFIASMATDNGWRIRNRISWSMLSGTLILFVLSTIHLSLALYETLIQIPFGNEAMKSGRIPWPDVVMCTVVNISVLITDGVLVVQSAAIIAVWVPVNMKIGPGTILTPFWGSTIVVNIYVTSMIVLRIWKAAKLSDSFNTGTKDLRFAIRILVESGALYLVVTIPHFIVWWTPNSMAIVLMGWINLPVVCSAYNLIIIRIFKHRAERRLEDKMSRTVPDMDFSVPSRTMLSMSSATASVTT
ncbi:hypothetical protein BDQ12DRAFT_663607 [Crucibulum laeve]|uniref:Uncharacterized protein n=1 Tax=Crucibulum laeve TaxID=68775 RepID=A0A5C3MAP0_9AGAR|nr:hypothetical protein BDQ12DRAFT_663607 [Crucibulum laeve]